jgi:hypothetical protein
LLAKESNELRLDERAEPVRAWFSHQNADTIVRIAIRTPNWARDQLLVRLELVGKFLDFAAKRMTVALALALGDAIRAESKLNRTGVESPFLVSNMLRSAFIGMNGDSPKDFLIR